MKSGMRNLAAGAAMLVEAAFPNEGVQAKESTNMRPVTVESQKEDSQITIMRRDIRTKVAVKCSQKDKKVCVAETLADMAEDNNQALDRRLKTARTPQEKVAIGDEHLMKAFVIQDEFGRSFQGFLETAGQPLNDAQQIIDGMKGKR